MSSEAPKLYVHKPKKAQLKKHLQQLRSSPSPSPSPSPSSSSVPSSTSVIPPKLPPAQPKATQPNESFARRFKFLWPLLLAVNLSVGAYVFMRTKKKDNTEEEVAAVSPSPISLISTVSVEEPVKEREPISLVEQHELYNWILEEKRKLKPKNPEEKKKIDEEKAILKQFIRAKSPPSL
ncbi:uncharacterized protein [Rutidosis leptorrhynchoides]|uniref:uncharacterized protein n=1 Tax=Rutidosis leptorrhynchoides TaxID=125765 RepID=UPI003A995D5E